MAYVVCQTSKCQQTYPLSDFEKTDKDIACPKCGGILIDKDGKANLSQNAWVIPVITAKEIQERNTERLVQKNQELTELQNEIHELESEQRELTGNTDEHTTPSNKKAYHMYTCEKGCGHTTIIDKFYKTKRAHCGVCGTKTTLEYQGECTVDMIPKQPLSAFMPKGGNQHA